MNVCDHNLDEGDDEASTAISRVYVFWQDAKLGKITKIGRERTRGD